MSQASIADELVEEAQRAESAAGWKAAYTLYRQAADLGAPAAYLRLAYYDQDGVDRPADPEKAEEHLRTYIDILGNAEARFNVAKIYSNMVNADAEKSAKYLIEAIDMGHKEAVRYARRSYALLIEEAMDNLKPAFDAAAAKNNYTLAGKIFEALSRFYETKGANGPLAP